jgi:hypothetical protein
VCKGKTKSSAGTCDVICEERLLCSIETETKVFLFWLNAMISASERVDFLQALARTHFSRLSARAAHGLLVQS